MKRLILASLAVAALASCSKESNIDVAISSSKNSMEFTTYASGATSKGAPVTSNDDFAKADNQFSVSAFFSASTGSNSGKYFDFSAVKYVTDGGWTNQKDMYWPNEDGKLYMGAYYPSDDTDISAGYTYDNTNYNLALTYAIEDKVADQIDLMYAIKEQAVATSSAGSEAAINLHFKHALTQIAFTATKDDDIQVSVSEVLICNVQNSGIFTANKSTDDTYTGVTTPSTDVLTDVTTDTYGSWATATGSTAKNYTAAMASTDAIAVSSSSTSVALTDADDALMLMPQALTAWSTTLGGTNDSGSYLAIKCVIKHVGTSVQASIVDGYVFVPFSTKGIEYASATTADAWKPGYKITYNLHFGGGYTTPGTDTVPSEGETPEDAVVTLREISYTTSVDAWVPIDEDAM